MTYSDIDSFRTQLLGDVGDNKEARLRVEVALQLLSETRASLEQLVEAAWAIQPEVMEAEIGSAIGVPSDVGIDRVKAKAERWESFRNLLMVAVPGSDAGGGDAAEEVLKLEAYDSWIKEQATVLDGLGVMEGSDDDDQAMSAYCSGYKARAREHGEKGGVWLSPDEAALLVNPPQEGPYCERHGFVAHAHRCNVFDDMGYEQKTDPRMDALRARLKQAVESVVVAVDLASAGDITVCTVKDAQGKIVYRQTGENARQLAETWIELNYPGEFLGFVRVGGRMEFFQDQKPS